LRDLAYNFRKFDPHQLLLLPPNLDDWLPQQHLARFLADVVANLDLKPLLRRYRPRRQGGPAFSPAMILRGLLYAYCMGVHSSRKIAQALIDDVAFRWLAAGNRPDFRTIATFRRQHLKCIKTLFLQVLLLCKQAGLVKVGIVALDLNLTWEKLTAEAQALLAEVESMLKRAESTDKEEDDRFGDDSGNGLPKIDSAKERLALPSAPAPYVAVKKDHKQRGDAEPAPRGRLSKNLPQRQRMERKLKTKVGKAFYKLRGQIVEAVFGRSRTVGSLPGSFYAVWKR
jgi:transposase